MIKYKCNKPYAGPGNEVHNECNESRLYNVCDADKGRVSQKKGNKAIITD